MNYIVKHKAKIEASSEEEAMQIYIKLWRKGFFDDPNLEVEELEERDKS